MAPLAGKECMANLIMATLSRHRLHMISIRLLQRTLADLGSHQCTDAIVLLVVLSGTTADLVLHNLPKISNTVLTQLADLVASQMFLHDLRLASQARINLTASSKVLNKAQVRIPSNHSETRRRVLDLVRLRSGNLAALGLLQITLLDSPKQDSLLHNHTSKALVVILAI